MHSIIACCCRVPKPQQLATYIGWLMHGTLGGVMAGGLFILPGVVAIMTLSIIYAVLGNVGIVAALFFGLKAAVLAIVMQAVVRVGKRALKNQIMRGVALAAFIAIFFFDVPFPVIILHGGRPRLPRQPFRGGSLRRSGGHRSAASKGHGPSALGEDLPAHARVPVSQAVRIAAVWSALWLTPVIALRLLVGPTECLQPDRHVLQRDGRRDVAEEPTRSLPMSLSRRWTTHWLRPGEMLDGLGMAEKRRPAP